MKILHSADWHLDSPLVGFSADQAARLRRELLAIPGKLSQLCRDEGCELVLLSGDLFDGKATTDSIRIVRDALEEMAVPVFVTPGNHDYISPESPWLTALWPENVHIFTKQEIESVTLPQLDCRIYGAGFTAMDCPGLLKDFHAQCEEKYAIGILHGDPTQVSSPYCPITKPQVSKTGLTYLALGHIHKEGSFRSGSTLCAWPGCPMGRGYDEEGQKGALIVTIEDEVSTRFVPLGAPCFYDLQVLAGNDAKESLAAALPPVDSEDFYRITFTGPSEPVDLAALQAEFSGFTNLVLRDKTTAPIDPWASIGEDSFEGMYFSTLKNAMEEAPEDQKQLTLLAARLSRQLLDGQEVVLP